MVLLPLVKIWTATEDALDEDMAASQYFETCGFEDEDDPAQRSAITCSVAQLGAALTRLANMSWMMEHGEANVGLKEQLVAFLESRRPGSALSGRREKRWRTLALP